jgi:hypothetical protein
MYFNGRIEECKSANTDVLSEPFTKHLSVYVSVGNPFQAHSPNKVTIQHNHLNRMNVIQNQKYK